MGEITKSTVLPEMKVAHAAKCRNTSGDSVMCHFTIDFTGCTLEEVLGYATSACTISGQRAWEKFSASELKDTVNGKTFHARAIGRKPKSDEQVKAEYMTRFNSASPEVKDQMIKELQAQMGEVEKDEDEIVE